MKMLLFPLLAAALLVPARGDECVLQFHPKAGATLETRVTRTSITRQEEGPTTTNVWERVVDDTFQADGDGYALQRRYVSLHWTRDGQDRTNPLYPLALEHPLTYRLRPDGSLLEVKGLDEVVAAIPDRVEEKYRETARKVFAAEAVFRGSLDEFDSFAGRNGRRVEPGTAWIELASDEGQNGYYSLFRVASLEARNGRTVVILTRRDNSDLEALRLLSPDAVAAFHPARPLAPSTLRIEGEGTQEIDAASLLPVAGEQTLHIEGAKDGAPFHREQTFKFESAEKR